MENYPGFLLHGGPRVHVHIHVCVVEGVFEAVAGEGDTDAAFGASPPGVIFHPASAIDVTAVAQAQADLRRPILRAFVGRGLIESVDAKDMLAYPHSGFSVDAGVCIQAHDRAGLKRLLRYCARPPFGRSQIQVLPLLCPLCGGQMRLIAFVTEGTQIRKILDHIGVDSEPPHIAPARGPLLWDDGGDALASEGVAVEPDWDLAAQPALDYEADQRISW